ncbi:MAG TPA: protein phosphatase 2C domain-containing protein [Pyrinomonadaceae bacterium]|nr:protein phosphatase 2C domain-containing protein [Pyrinomonadaceae bacterium]
MTENNFQIDSAAVSDRGLSEKRPQNEDSYLEMNERGLFAVADGVGGAQAGDVASQMAVEILSEAFSNLRENSDAEEMMRVAVERANESIFQMAHDLPQLATMATTIVALHVSGNIATIGHVGDSRLYRLDTKGNLHRETGDHSVVEEEVRAGRMTSEQAANHPSRNVISRAVGADSTVEVDMKTIMFEPRTTFLLCSDGITRHIDDAELRELLLSGDTPANIALKMKEICYRRGAEDNLTAVIAKITDSVAGRFAPAKTAALPAAELEEPTVATSRPLIVDNSAAKTSGLEEIPTGELSPTFAANQPVRQEIVRSTETLVPETTDVALTPNTGEKNEPIVKTETIEKIDAPPLVIEKKVEVKPEEAEVKSYPVDEGSSGFLGKILSAAMWLILGGILGAGLYYLFLQNNKMPDTPVLTEMQTPNIEYTSFENNRRNVDRNPRRFISTNAAPPDDAEGLYLLGRAYLLNGQFAEAGQTFLLAKDRLAQTKEINAKVLANDIETGLIIVRVPAAQDEFKKALSSNNNGLPSNLNVNANQLTNQPTDAGSGNQQTP